MLLLLQHCGDICQFLTSPMNIMSFYRWGWKNPHNSCDRAKSLQAKIHGYFLNYTSQRRWVLVSEQFALENLGWKTPMGNGKENSLQNCFFSPSCFLIFFFLPWAHLFSSFPLLIGFKHLKQLQKMHFKYQTVVNRIMRNPFIEKWPLYLMKSMNEEKFYWIICGVIPGGISIHRTLEQKWVLINN